MKCWRIMFFLVVSFFSVQCCSVALDSQQKFYRTFWNPQYRGTLLNYCLKDGVQCGQPVADRYCQSMGYDRATQSTIAHNVGKTRYFLTCEQCKSWRCNGFKRISCVAEHRHRPPRAYYYRLRQFVYPRYQHYRVDWCYRPGEQCGHRAAFSFCRRMGYSTVKKFEKESNLAATKTLENQQLCFGVCHGFKSITCYR